MRSSTRAHKVPKKKQYSTQACVVSRCPCGISCGSGLQCRWSTVAGRHFLTYDVGDGSSSVVLAVASLLAGLMIPLATSAAYKQLFNRIFCFSCPHGYFLSRSHSSSIFAAARTAGVRMSSSTSGPHVTAYTGDFSICSHICRLAIVEHGLKPENVNIDLMFALENYDVSLAHC